MEGVLGDLPMLCLIVGPFACFVVVVLVGTLRCVARLLLPPGGLFLYRPMCPSHSGLVLGIL
jgi:hypothetical protein